MFFHRMSLGPMECLVALFVGALVLAAIVAVVVLLARASQHGLKATRSDEPLAAAAPPLDVLRRRLAAGEITPEQFDDLRRRLEE